MIEIARFADVYEAEIAAARLRAEGFDPVLGGSEHVKTNFLILQALGGVNLSLPTDQADAGRSVLAGLRGGTERIEAAELAPADRQRKRGLMTLLAFVGLAFGSGA